MFKRILKLSLILEVYLSMLFSPFLPFGIVRADDQQEFLQTIEGWRTSQAGGIIDKEAWDTAMAYYFNTECKSGSCPCLVGVADLKAPIPHPKGGSNGANTQLWIGHMKGGSPTTIIKSVAAANWSSTQNGSYHLSSQCDRGGSGYTFCNASQCCYGPGQGRKGCDSIERLQRYEKLLNEEGQFAKKGGTILRYFIDYPIAGGLGLHAGDYCLGNETTCGARTAGCVAYNPRAQKKFCDEIYNKDRNMSWTVYHPGRGGKAPSADSMSKAAKVWAQMGKKVSCSSQSSPMTINDQGNASPQKEGGFTGTDDSSNSGLNPSGSDAFNNCQQLASTSHVDRTEKVDSGDSPDASYTRTVDEVNQESNPDGAGGKMIQAAATQATVTNCHASNASEVRSSGGMIALIGIVAAGGLAAWLIMKKDDDDKDKKKDENKATTEAQKAQDEEQTEQYAENTSSVPDDYMISPDAAVTATAGEGQTVDSQAAINAGDLYQSSLQYEYEQAKNDKEQTVINLNNSAAQYSNSGDKQAEANDYKNISSDMAVASVESYEDVYENRVAVMNRRLETFPTLASVSKYCAQRMTDGKLLNQDAYKSMTNHYKDVLEVPELRMGSESEVCNDYLERDADHLFKNQQVVDQLNGIIDDSVNVLQGLDDLKQAIKDEKLSPSDRANILKNHPVLKTLGDRYKMLDSCERIGCWDNPKSNFRRVGQELGPVRDNELNRMGNELRTSLVGGTRLQTNYNIKDSPKFSALFKDRSFDPAAFRSLTASRKSAVKGHSSSKLKDAPNSKLVKEGAEDEANSTEYAQTNITYRQGLSNVEFTRDENGILRNKKSQKPVEGFEAPSYQDIFQIISTRYQKKFFKN